MARSRLERWDSNADRCSNACACSVVSSSQLELPTDLLPSPREFRLRRPAREAQNRKPRMPIADRCEPDIDRRWSKKILDEVKNVSCGGINVDVAERAIACTRHWISTSHAIQLLCDGRGR